jgi:Protein of unknown function (DUF3309)
MGSILLIVLLVQVIGGLPRWSYSKEWGYRPSGGLGFVLLIILVFVLMGFIPRGF